MRNQYGFLQSKFAHNVETVWAFERMYLGVTVLSMLSKTSL